MWIKNEISKLENIIMFHILLICETFNKDCLDKNFIWVLTLNFNSF